MSLVDLRAFVLPGVVWPLPFDAEDSQPAMLLSEADGILSDEEASAVQGILREVAALLSKTPEALGSMRRRLGIVVDCLIAVADEIDGDCDLESHFAGTIRPGQDECEPDEHTYGFEPNFATTADEDACGQYAGQNIGLWYASQLDETEEDCEDEGAQCDDEGIDSDLELTVSRRVAGGQGGMKGRDTIDAIEAGDRATIQQGFRTLIDPREGKVELGADRRIVRAVTR